MGHLARCALILASLALCSCGAIAKWNEPTPAPMEFSIPDWLTEFHSAQTPAMLERRMARSRCDKLTMDMTDLGMKAGMLTRPDLRALVVETGTLANGADWYALKDARDRSDAFCGISLAADPPGSAVALFGIRRQHRAAAIEAVERGTFFCECEALSDP